MPARPVNLGAAPAIGTAAPAPGTPPVFSATANLPGPAPIDEIKPPSIMLPDDPWNRIS